jgi:S1-C subfamily serine protease
VLCRNRAAPTFTVRVASPKGPALHPVDTRQRRGDDDLMVLALLRVSFLACLFLISARVACGQALSVLHIKVVVIDAGGKITAVSRHALLISDNPPSAPPRRILTSADGTANVRLRPGNYTVESDQPVSFQGRVYQWTERVDVVAGRDAMLDLTADNAAVEPLGATTSASSLETDPSFLFSQWQGSVVAIWTPMTHASGFIVDAKGLVATNQRVIGTATAAEVQLTPDVKVSARVLVADPKRDVAVLWIDPMVLASARPVPLGCGDAASPSVADGQALFAIGAPLGGEKRMTSGTVTRVDPRSIISDFRLPSGSAGGPVFSVRGGIVGITSIASDNDDSRRTLPVVHINEACEVVASALAKMQGLAPPDGTHLPVEPARPYPPNALKEMAQRRVGSLSPPQISSSDFDVAFITPVLTYGAQYQSEQARGRDRGAAGSPRTGSDVLRPIREFSNWSGYVSDFPPVLLVRVTPKMAEGFWTMVARGAAQTQGVALPPMKRARAGFARMRAFCGDAEVTPIHPLMLEQRVGDTDAVYEGLYVFDPGALGPHCGTVKLVLYSEKEPEKGDTRIVDAGVLERIWEDFAPYRTAAAPPR